MSLRSLIIRFRPLYNGNTWKQTIIAKVELCHINSVSLMIREDTEVARGTRRTATILSRDLGSSTNYLSWIYAMKRARYYTNFQFARIGGMRA